VKTPRPPTNAISQRGTRRFVSAIITKYKVDLIKEVT